MTEAGRAFHPESYKIFTICLKYAHKERPGLCSTCPMPMTCPISWMTTPSSVPASSKLTMSAMSKVIDPSKLMEGQSFQISDGPAEPRVPPGPSIIPSIEIIRRRPAGLSGDPPHGTWVIMSVHLRTRSSVWGAQCKRNGNVYDTRQHCAHNHSMHCMCLRLEGRWMGRHNPYETSDCKLDATLA